MKVQEGMSVRFNDGETEHQAVVLKVNKEQKTVDLRLTLQGGEVKDVQGIKGDKNLGAWTFKPNEADLHPEAPSDEAKDS